MNPFNTINDILFHKKNNALNDIDSEREFSPFLIQRWLSMYSPDIAKILNITTNRLYPIYEFNQDWYHAFLGIVPKVSQKRIKYIKKLKDKENSTIDKEYKKKVDLLAKSYNISKREVEYYIQSHNIDIKGIKVN